MAAAEIIDVKTLRDEQLKQELQTFRQSVTSVRISDQASYSLATDLLVEIKTRQKKVVEFFAKMKADAYSTWKEICSRENQAAAPLAEAERHLKSEVARWTAEQERIRIEAERKAREEAERLQAEALEAQIEEAESAGASVEEVAALCEMPMVAPAPVVQPTYQQNTAVATRKVYKAEVTDLRLLAKAVAEGKVPASYIVPNMVALNQRAKSDGAALSIPGVRVICETQVAARSK